ncbi:hypothetical protein [Bartonella queenslandensis]|nr:hypothetical protein [Bartonella queenslandensis]
MKGRERGKEPENGGEKLYSVGGRARGWGVELCLQSSVRWKVSLGFIL